jgi:hypothetical protein
VLPPAPPMLPDDSDLELILLLSFEGVEDPDPLLLKDVELGDDAYTIVVVIELVSINVVRKRHKVNLTENLLFDFIFWLAISFNRSFLQAKQDNIQ